MTYKVEISPLDHQQTLKATLADWARQEHDVFLVSNEGHKLFSQKVLLSFYSPMIQEALPGIPNSCPGISVPASSSSLSSLLQLLLYGQIFNPTKEASSAVREAAAALGIDLQNCSLENKSESFSGLSIIKLPLKTGKMPVKSITTGSQDSCPVDKSVAVEKLSSSATPDYHSLLQTNFPSSVSSEWKPAIPSKVKLNKDSRVDPGNVKTEEGGADGSAEHICEVCETLFLTGKYLQRHRYKIHGLRGYLSQHRVKKKSKSLEEGKEEHKNDIIENICDVCQKLYGSSKLLQRHRFKIHGLRGSKRHLSTEIRFKRLKKERQELQNNIVAENMCEVCQNQFVSSKSLQRHRFKIHGLRGRKRGSRMVERDRKVYKCTECDKILNKSSALKLHMNIHLTDRPFACMVCNKGFNQKANLRLHLEKIHGMENVPNSDINTSEDKIEILPNTDLDISDGIYEENPLSSSIEKQFYQVDTEDDTMILHMHSNEMREVKQIWSSTEFESMI